MTPTTSPPAASTASAMTPMSPTRPPPYTRPSLRAASSRPSSLAASANLGSFPSFDPQKTQTRFTGPSAVARAAHQLLLDDVAQVLGEVGGVLEPPSLPGREEVEHELGAVAEA